MTFLEQSCQINIRCRFQQSRPFPSTFSGTFFGSPFFNTLTLAILFTSICPYDIKNNYHYFVLKTFFLFVSQDYLNKYHYISPTRSGNHDVATAVRRFQEFFQLPVTGKIDDATRRQMEKPRCGLPDPVESTRHKRYATASKWGKTYLKYFIQVWVFSKI